MVGGGLFQLISHGSSLGINNHGNHGVPWRIRRKRKNKIKKIIFKDKKYKNFIKIDKYNQRKCCICLSRFKFEEYVIVRKCKHIYHKDCHNAALILCPICRQ